MYGLWERDASGVSWDLEDTAVDIAPAFLEEGEDHGYGGRSPCGIHLYAGPVEMCERCGQ